MESAQVPLDPGDADQCQFARIKFDVDELKQSNEAFSKQMEEMSQDIERLQGGQKPCQQHPMTSAELIEGTETVKYPLFYNCGSSITQTKHKHTDRHRLEQRQTQKIVQRIFRNLS